MATRLTRLLGALALALVAALGAGGCGGSSSSTTTATAPRLAPFRVVLDFVPNAVHAGLYLALRRGLFRREGLDVRFVAPTATAQPLAEVAAGRADLALADLIDVSIARAQGTPLQAVAAVVQRPLVSLMARGDGPVRRPRDLVGRSVGLTGVPSDRAIARAIISADGGDPDRVRYLVIGFSAVPSLVGRKVDAAIGFWPSDGVELSRRAPARFFRIERYGGPPFPELVVFGSQRGIAHRAAAVRAFLRAAREGYAQAEQDPAAAVDALAAAAPGIDRSVSAASLRRFLPIFHPPGQPWGGLDLAVLRRFAAWGRRIGALPPSFRAAGLVSPLALRAT
jgi:NitT/TauT family transport system substrate-binding protein/putative hydroxymethylpyrimidine transport system substrate-binding protein